MNFWRAISVLIGTCLLGALAFLPTFAAAAFHQKGEPTAYRSRDHHAGEYKNPGVENSEYNASEQRDSGPEGCEFQINTYTTGDQTYPSLAMTDEGDFVVIWQSYDQDGSGIGIFARLYDAQGAPITGEFLINEDTDLDQWSGDIRMDRDGNFLVVWESENPIGYTWEIMGRLFSSDGTPLGEEVRINSHYADEQRRPVVDMKRNGDFIVAWESFLQDGSEIGSFVRLFDSDSEPMTGDIQANVYTHQRQWCPAPALNASGSFTVVWESENQDGSEWSIFGRQFDAVGAPVAGEININSQISGDQANPAIASDDEGNFIVVWQSNGPGSDDWDIFCRRFDSTGASLEEEFRANSYTANQQVVPSVFLLDDGGFLLTWDSYGQDAAGDYGVFSRGFDVDAQPWGEEVQANTHTESDQSFSSVGFDAEGNFVVVWRSNNQDGSGYGAFGQMFWANQTPRCPLGTTTTTTPTSTTTTSTAGDDYIEPDPGRQPSTEDSDDDGWPQGDISGGCCGQ